MKLQLRCLSIALACGFLAHIAAAQELRKEHPGRAVYQQYCAACHDTAATRAPALSALQQMSAQSVRLALTEGVMKAQGSLIPKERFDELVGYVAASDAGNMDWVAPMLCAAERRNVDLNQPASWTMFGTDIKNSRRLTAQQAALASADLPRLELAWAIAFPKVTSLRAAPVIVGSTLFYTPTPTGKLLALDTQSACVKWSYDAGVPLRTSIAYGDLGTTGKKALVFADSRAQVHAIDAKTGTLIWKANGRHDSAGGITGAPVLYKDRIIVPVSASGVGAGANPQHECCGPHGAVVALDANTGAKIWTMHTMKDAEYTGKVSSAGVKLRGPSGAPIWSTPSIDETRGLVYAGTGQATSLPATDTSDAVLAIDVASGELKWSFQALANDVWHMGCGGRSPDARANCPAPEDSVLKDYDFGAGVVIAKRKNGKDILLAGQKSGDLWGLDPDAKGQPLWRQTFGMGTALGGIHWGLASDGERVFAPIADPIFDPKNTAFKPEPGMNAVEIDSGKVLWRTPVSADCGNGRQQRYALCSSRYGLSAAPLVIDRSVVAASLDGRVYIFDTATGAIVWTYDTLRDFQTVNGVAGKGGSIDSHSIFAGAGMLFIASGYGAFNQPPGNVLLAFRPAKK